MSLNPTPQEHIENKTQEVAQRLLAGETVDVSNMGFLDQKRLFEILRAENPNIGPLDVGVEGNKRFLSIDEDSIQIHKTPSAHDDNAINTIVDNTPAPPPEPPSIQEQYENAKNFRVEIEELDNLIYKFSDDENGVDKAAYLNHFAAKLHEASPEVRAAIDNLIEKEGFDPTIAEDLVLIIQAIANEATSRERAIKAEMENQKAEASALESSNAPEMRGNMAMEGSDPAMQKMESSGMNEEEAILLATSVANPSAMVWGIDPSLINIVTPDNEGYNLANPPQPAAPQVAMVMDGPQTDLGAPMPKNPIT